ncbi:HD domain-containing protein [Candidatus Saccharibacteria bacterium]|nr:HD domain-containing protein [Candidatus Saccharibacteria bacterium]
MSENKTRSILDFYVLMDKLKTTIRTGWKIWQISAPRIESVAEHVFGCQMLALAIISEYELELDLEKVILMLAVHEVGEAAVGDITPWDGMSKNEKIEIESDAVKKIMCGLKRGDEIEQIYLEFEKGESAEARFCKQVDKLEACLQVKIYDEEGYANFDQIKSGALEIRRKEMLEKGNETLSSAWIENDIDIGKIFDKELLEITNYAKDNNIKERE